MGWEQRSGRLSGLAVTLSERAAWPGHLSGPGAHRGSQLLVITTDLGARVGGSHPASGPWESLQA